MRNEIKINKIVGCNYDGIVIIDSVFQYDDGTHGVTGMVMHILSQDDIDERNDIDHAREWVRELWQDAVATGNTEDGLDDYTQQCIDDLGCSDELFLGDDPSFRSLAEDLYDDLSTEDKDLMSEEIGYKDEDFVTFDVLSCGRIFGDNFVLSTCIDEKLYDLVRRFDRAENTDVQFEDFRIYES